MENIDTSDHSDYNDDFLKKQSDEVEPQKKKKRKIIIKKRVKKKKSNTINFNQNRYFPCDSDINFNSMDLTERSLCKEIDTTTLLFFKTFTKKVIILKITNLLKLLYIFTKIRKCQINSSIKITKIYRGYSLRKKLKLNILTEKILKYRAMCASKIIAYYKGFEVRKISKPIIEKKKDNYIIYSSLANNKLLYFKITFIVGVESNIHFDFCKILNCFIFFVNKKQKILCQSKLEGFFYNENFKKLTDDMYDKNEVGENILNFQKIIKKNKTNMEKYDKIIKEFLKKCRKNKETVMKIDEYEEIKKKRKALDDDELDNNIKRDKMDKINKMKRIKSCMKLKKEINRGILKPSKSYINLRTDDKKNKKIQFGIAKIKKYFCEKYKK